MSESTNDFRLLLGEQIYNLCRLFVALEQPRAGLNLPTFLARGLVARALFSREHGEELVKLGLLAWDEKETDQ